MKDALQASPEFAQCSNLPHRSRSDPESNIFLFFRKCYRLAITPRRREKYLIQGQIWIDAEDWSIVRIQGSPAKHPSFWTRQTQIDRRYKRIDGIWLNDSLESTSDILIAGRSTLRIQYLYEAIETDGSMERLGEASVPCPDR